MSWAESVSLCVLIITFGVVASTDKPETKSVKCPQVEQSTPGPTVKDSLTVQRITEPRNDKRIGHPLPPGPMKPSSWG